MCPAAARFPVARCRAPITTPSPSIKRSITATREMQRPPHRGGATFFRDARLCELEQVPAVLNRGIPIGRGWAESWRVIRLLEARHAHILFVGFAGTGDRSG